MRNDFYAGPLSEEILGSILEYTAMGAISTRKTNRRSTERVAKTKNKKWSNYATLPNIKDFFKPRVRNVVQNEIEAKYTEINVIN